MIGFVCCTCWMRCRKPCYSPRGAVALIWTAIAKLVLALVKEIEIIGEAASQISESTWHQWSVIPWADIIGMRNRLVHAYFDINLDILWQTIQHDLPPLIAELSQGLQE